MHDLYVKFMIWAAGASLANSDRLKTVIAGFLVVGIAKLLAGCAICSTFLTPDVIDQLTKGIAGAVVLLVISLTHRDVAAPGQTVPGAAVPADPTK